MLRRAEASAPRTVSVKSAPISGRKVTTERIGQFIGASTRKHQPGDQQSDADQHREGVVVEVAGLQAHGALRDVEDAGRYAVRAKAVDQPAIALLPQEAAEPLGRANEDEVIELVEVPLVEKE